MHVRTLLWALVALDVLILFPALYMAAEAAGIAGEYQGSFAALAIAILFLALPVICIAAPFAAWRAHVRRGHHRHAVVLAALPPIYAVFLVLFLLFA